MDYKSAGVDIDKAETLVEHVKTSAASTNIPGVLSGVGGFGALFEIDTQKYKKPVLASATDGVGTKILVAQEMGDFSGMGDDLVAMNVDDIICSGAKPLFFIDYIAVGKLQDDMYIQLIDSITGACKKAGCALIGGETAELPGMYGKDEFDLAGFTVGVVEKDLILKKESVNKGDKVIGLASSGFHSNGFSLVRKIVGDKGLDLKKDYGFGTLGDALLSPTRIYAKAIVDALAKFGDAIHGISHITGGGIQGNLNRVLPKHLDAKIDTASWKIPAMMSFLIEQGGVDTNEAYKVFNMGIGMALVVKPEMESEISRFFVDSICEAYSIGEITDGNGKVNL